MIATAVFLLTAPAPTRPSWPPVVGEGQIATTAVPGRRCATRVQLAADARLTITATVDRTLSAEATLPPPRREAERATLTFAGRSYPQVGAARDDGTMLTVGFDLGSDGFERIVDSSFLSVRTAPGEGAWGWLKPADRVQLALIDCLNAFDRTSRGSSAPAIAAPSLRNGQAVIGSGDYPADALLANAQGVVRYRAAVSAEGYVSDCTVTASSGAAALDAAACRLLRLRARFTPARDAEGRATAGVAEGGVNWRLPAD